MDFPSSETTENKTESKSENCQEIAETVDPDYVSVLPEKLQASLNLQQQDAKEHAIQKIKDIVRHQFALEMHLKEQEIETIDQRIHQTKATLDRLRACVLARYYGMSQGFQEAELASTASRSTWSKPRRTRRDCAKSYRGMQLNHTGSLSGSPMSFSNTRDLGIAKLTSSMETPTSYPTLSLPTKPMHTTIPGQKQSLNLSFDKARPATGSTAFTSIKSENLSCPTKLGITNGELERDSGVVSSLTNPTALVASRSSSQSGASIESKRNLTLLGAAKETSTTDDIRHMAKEIPSNINATKGHSVMSVISGSHSSDVGPIGLGSHLSGSLNVKGIQLNANGTDSSVSLQLKETPANTCTGGNQLGTSNLADSQANIMRNQLSVLNSEGTSKTGLGSQLSGSSNLRGIHVNALEDISSQSNVFGSGSRFYIKKRVIIGNTSKYIAPEKREENDKSTHKWMVYVRGPPEDPHINVYIQKVWFFLHPSYRPNDIIEVNKPPFHLTRRGWGEFPIRVQLHFVGSRNKRVDIIHELRLDKTYTGLQTLGAETVVDLEIDRKTFEDLGIPVPMDVTQDKVWVDCISDNTKQVDKNDINNASHPGISKLKREYPSNATSSSSFGSDLATAQDQLSNSSQLKKPKIVTPMSSVISTPCGSRLGSRCVSPVPASTGSFLMEDELVDRLYSFAEKIPLISSKKDVVNLPFSAKTAKEFLSWNIGKRRAAEWQRATKIRAQIKKCVDSTKVTTKDVMIWCRRFGYTPQEDLVLDPEVEYCKICGRITEQDRKKESDALETRLCIDKKCLELTKLELSSLTPVTDVLAEIEEKEKLLSELSNQRNNDEENAQIDVVGMSSTKKPLPTSTHQPSRLLTVPLTTQQQWIKDVCNDIGVGLRPVVMEGVEVHAVESALLTIAMKFMENLMRTASSLSKHTDTSLDSKLIVPAHIYQAIRALRYGDFLSNSYFGHSEN